MVVAFGADDTSKTFTFTAVQDTVDDDGESLKLTFGTLPARVSEGTTKETVVTITDDDHPALTVSFENAAYTVEEDDEVSISITDDDTAGITVDPTVDEGDDETYTVVLDSKPSANVVVTVKDPTDNTEVTSSPATLTFTTSNWDDEQTVTVSAAQNTDAADNTATVTHTATSTDTDYNNADIDDVDVTVTDDEDPQVSVSFEKSAYSVAEGSTVTVKVTLSADPERTVIINLYRNHQDGVTTEDYEFTPDCFRAFFNSGDTEKSITLTAVQDTVDD